MTDLDGRLGARQIQGDRDYQEDDFGISHLHGEGDEGEQVLLVLADGMGGHVAGATASGLAVRRFLEAFEELSGDTAEKLRFALDAANNEIHAAVEKNPEWDGMGCTLLGVSISRTGLQWISVGDSPLWLYADGKLERLNADHSMAPVIANLVEAGHLTEEEAARDKRKSALRSAVMGEEIELVDLKEEPLEIDPRARILLASDGVETLGDDEIAAILEEHSGSEAGETVAALIGGVEARAKPGQDNTTVLLFEPGSLEGNEDSMTIEEVQSIVRRAKGLKKGESAPDPQTVAGTSGEEPASGSMGLYFVIGLLILALVAALAWIFFVDREQHLSDDLLEHTPGAVAPPGTESGVPEPGSGEGEEPPVERTEIAPPPPESPPQTRRAGPEEEVPVEIFEDPAKTPRPTPGGAEGGEAPAKEAPVEGGGGGAVAPSGGEEAVPPESSIAPPASGAPKGEEKPTEKKEQEEPPPAAD